MSPTWHVSAGWKITGRTTGQHCGFVGLFTAAESQEEGWAIALAWLRKGLPLDTFLLHTWNISVKRF